MSIPVHLCTILSWALSTHFQRSKLVEKHAGWGDWQVSLWILFFSSNSNLNSTLWVIWDSGEEVEDYQSLSEWPQHWSTFKLLQNCHPCLNWRWAHIISNLFAICAGQHKDEQTWGEKRVSWSLDDLWGISHFLHYGLVVGVWAVVDAVCWTVVRLRTL